MQVTLEVKRVNSEVENGSPYTQGYDLDVPDHFTVLDLLIKVREEEDETLGFRCSCRASICGSCAMRMNGHAGLACKTKLVNVMTSEGLVKVEPAGNLPVVKDLVVDMKPFWDKVHSIQPWLQTKGPQPEAEYLVSADAMQDLTGVMGCIMCGACVSDCTVLEVDKNFLGPAALAKAYRFVGDPRDGADQERLGLYNQYGGVWDCTRCFECVQVCPKGVAPMERIMELREKTLEAGYQNTYGARHTLAFEKLVEHSGWLDELRLVPMTVGFFNIPKLIGMLPVAIRAGYNRKVPPMFHKAIPGVKNFRRMVKKVKDMQKEEKEEA